MSVNKTLAKPNAKPDKDTLSNLHVTADKEASKSAEANTVPKPVIKPGDKRKAPLTRRRDLTRQLVWKACKQFTTFGQSRAYEPSSSKMIQKGMTN